MALLFCCALINYSQIRITLLLEGETRQYTHIIKKCMAKLPNIKKYQYLIVYCIYFHIK